MSRRWMHCWDRLPGRFPRRVGLRLPSIPPEDLVLLVLWTVVVLGLAVLVGLAVAGLFGGPLSRAERLAATAFAAELDAFEDDTGPEVDGEIDAALPAPSRSLVEPLAQGGPVEDISPDTGVDQGRMMESVLRSGLVGRELPYRIYLPPQYLHGQDRFPVLYLLHGNGSSHVEWTDKNHIGSVADDLMSTGAMHPMLIVMPEGEHSYFMNHAFDGPRWADYVAFELVPFIDSTYRTIPDREHRAVGGLSMGGEGALQLAFNHPDLFSAVGANSPSLHLSLEDAPAFFGDWDYYADYDPLRLAAAKAEIGSLRIWVDAGEQDPWLAAAECLHTVLQSRGVEHQWHVFLGAHDNSYWNYHLPDYLSFYSDSITGEAEPVGS